MLLKSNKKLPMTNKQYFVKTFTFVFFFVAFCQIAYKIVTARDEVTFDYFLKLSAIAFFFAFMLGIINYFARIDFFSSKFKNVQ